MNFRCFLPPVQALGASQDRLHEKTLFRQLKIPTPPFMAVDSLDDLRAAAAQIGLPGVLKTRRLGYDGRGQFYLRKPADIETAWETLGVNSKAQLAQLERVAQGRVAQTLLEQGTTLADPAVVARLKTEYEDKE